MERTQQQKSVIDTTDCQLLVSAGAGSGKTSVMIERAVNFVIKNGSVENLLMITFTNAAATEMRAKMEKELQLYLNNCSEQNLKAHIKEQLNLLGQADICTVHNFCQKLIKKYFFVINIDPSFSIIDESESMVLRERALNLVFNKLLDKNDNSFFDLLSVYDEKRNFKKLSTIVLKTFDFLQQLPEIDEFEKDILSLYESDINENEITKTINNFVINKMQYFVCKFEELNKNAKINGYEKIENITNNILTNISQINSKNNFETNHKLIFLLPSLPPKPVNGKDYDINELNENYANIKEEFNADILKIKNKIYCSENFDEIVSNFKWCEKNVQTIFMVTKLFSQYYSDLKRENNQMDFSDLEHFALKILKDNSIKEQVKDNYKQIYVDEYQDINNIQESIIQSVASENNLFLVGDVKQSIYRFRNTNPQIFVDKFNQFNKDGKNKKAKELNVNFRSDEAILDFVNFVFTRAMTKEIASVDYEKNGKLDAGIQFVTPENGIAKTCICVVKQQKEKKEKPEACGIYSVEKAEQQPEEESVFAKTEAYIVAQKITELMSEQKVIYDPKLKSLRPIEFNDITLLVRNRGEYLDTLTSYLRLLGVPVNSVSGVSIFEEYEIQVLHNYLKLLLNTQDDYTLTAFLSSPSIGLSMQELSDIRLKNSDINFYLACFKEQSFNKKVSFAFQLINDGRLSLINGSIYEVLNNFLTKTNLLAYFATMENGKQRLINVQTYLQHFLSHSYNYDLVSYLNFVEKSEKVNIPIQNLGGVDAVNIRTMHESKGLEYPIVFIVDSGHNFNTDSLKGSVLFSTKFGLGIEAFDKQLRVKYSTLTRSAIVIEEDEQQFAEELRLLYVAMTRAKNNLYIIGKASLDNIYPSIHKFDLQKKTSFLSILLSLLGETNISSIKNDVNKIAINSSNKNQFLVECYEPLQEEDLVLDDKNCNYVNKKNIDSDKFLLTLYKYCGKQYEFNQSTSIALKSSITKIMQQEQEENNYNEAPYRFNLNEINPMDTSAEIGTAYHKAMQFIDYSLNSVDEVEKYLKKVLLPDELSLINCHTIYKCIKHFKPLMENAQVLREQRFFMLIPYNEIVPNNQISDKILIQGAVDLIIIKDNAITLVDFKTTKQKDANKIWQKYKIQLECYKKAVENAFNLPVSKKIIYSFLNELEISFDK